MTTRLVIIGDTHLPRFGRDLPSFVRSACADADLILHAGDHTDPFVLNLLAGITRTEAVAGNNDPPELVDRLGFSRTVEVEGCRIGLTHGHLGAGRSTPDRAWATFAASVPAVDAIAFGHSHQPMIDRRDGTWLLNPGSPTDRRRQPTFSLLRVDVDGREIRPELVTSLVR